MRSFLLSPLLALVACGGAVAPSTEAPPVSTEPLAWTESGSCESVRASCGGGPAVLVFGHATGLSGLEGARVEFAVRYVLDEGVGLDGAHGVALGRTSVRGGAFSTCVCVPHGAHMYPQVAAVVYRPGTTGLASADVVRATFSQRYATLGDEDVTDGLAAPPSDLQKELGVAAMVERTAKATLELGAGDGHRVVGGLISDDRPLAVQLVNSTFGPTNFSWTMPGRASASERIAFFVDQNDNGKCDDGDRGGLTPFAAATRFDGAWLTGPALSPVCKALMPDAPRY